MVTVEITKNPFATIIGHARNDAEKRALFATIRTTMIRTLKDAAIEKGGKSFWRDVANSVTGESDADSAIVGATHPAAGIRQFGGTISAPGQGPMSTGAEHLAIPVDDRAKGKSPRFFNGIFCAERKRDGALFLFRRLNGETELFYVLKDEVEHPADPWLPSDHKRADELRAAAHAWLDSRKRN